jgi:hypothetical protein
MTRVNIVSTTQMLASSCQFPFSLFHDVLFSDNTTSMAKRAAVVISPSKTASTPMVSMTNHGGKFTPLQQLHQTLQQQQYQQQQQQQQAVSQQQNQQNHPSTTSIVPPSISLNLPQHLLPPPIRVPTSTADAWYVATDLLELLQKHVNHNKHQLALVLPLSPFLFLTSFARRANRIKQWRRAELTQEQFILDVCMYYAPVNQ